MPYLADRVRMTAAGLVVLSIVLWIALGLTGCSRTKVETTDVPRPDPIWAEFLASHTTGVISRKSRIRVVFATDVVEAERIGQDARDVLQFQPALEGTSAFVSTRELVFTPRTELTPATVYRVALRPMGLLGVTKTLPAFEFAVHVKRPEFEVSLGGLTANVAEERSMAFSGVVMTADAERPEKVESLLSGVYAGRPAPVTWEHAADGQRHAFKIRGLRRAAGEQTLTLRWSGEPIGATNRGERQIAVPPQDRFVITQVLAAEGEGERYIAVFFSDTLDRQQDFKGLVRLSAGNASTRVDGNVLRVYSDQVTSGEVTLTVERGIRSRFDQTLAETNQYPVVFASTKPQVRFVGSGTILPQAQTLSVPFEAVGVRSVRVTAFRVYEDNLSQFLQVNTLSGSHELGRVGRNLWRKTIPLNAADLTRWNRYSLDVTELLKKYPDGLVRLSLSVRRENSVYACDGSTSANTEEPRRSGH